MGAQLPSNHRRTRSGCTSSTSAFRIKTLVSGKEPSFPGQSKCLKILRPPSVGIPPPPDETRSNRFETETLNHASVRNSDPPRDRTFAKQPASSEEALFKGKRPTTGELASVDTTVSSKSAVTASAFYGEGRRSYGQVACQPVCKQFIVTTHGQSLKLGPEKPPTPGVPAGSVPIAALRNVVSSSHLRNMGATNSRQQGGLTRFMGMASMAQSNRLLKTAASKTAAEIPPLSTRWSGAADSSKHSPAIFVIPTASLNRSPSSEPKDAKLLTPDAALQGTKMMSGKPVKRERRKSYEVVPTATLISEAEPIRRAQVLSDSSFIHIRTHRTKPRKELSNDDASRRAGGGEQTAASYAEKKRVWVGANGKFSKDRLEDWYSEMK